MIIQAAAFAMGTRFELVVAGDEQATLRAAADAAVEEIQEWDQRLSLFRADSIISHINRSAHERPVRMDRETFDLIALAREVWEQSERALDITMASVMKRLGFHNADSSAPDAAAWGMDAVVLNPADLSIHFTRPGLALDLGAIGKGHAIDRALAVLHEHHIRTALVHAGTSSVGAVGAPDDQPDGWRIALTGPGAPIIRLRDRSLSVSGQHSDRTGGRPGHILDPRTGAPAHGASLACVVGSSGRLTEAWSTALLVLNRRPDRIPQELVSILHTPEAPWRIEGPDIARSIIAAAPKM